jgi:chromate reductase
MKIIGLCGSLREQSVNRCLLLAAAEFLPKEFHFEILSCELPLYNKDLDGVTKPVPVQQFIDTIRAGDGLIIASPEYNYSIPGVLKNAIDWASRPAYKSVLVGKPTAILSGSGSDVGGARAQVHLRDVLVSTLTPVVPVPPFIVAKAPEKLDEKGNIIDEALLGRLKRYIDDYISWARFGK